jgi:uncharacterized phiE125 gp8 family phage protein
MTTSGWALRRIVEPLIEPVTLAEAKLQCQIDADIISQDSRIEGMIRAARELAEAYIKGSLCEQTWRLRLNNFPGEGEAIPLPMGPVQEVLSISYYDSDGALQTVSGSQVDLDDEPPRIYPPLAGSWPAVQYRINAVEVVYRAGYPSTGSPAGADGVPVLIRQAILARVAAMFNQREDEVIGVSRSDAAFGFERSLDPFRRYP